MRRVLVHLALLLSMTLCPAASANARAPSALPGKAIPSSIDIRQLKHSRWTVEDGAPPNIVAIAQSADGFLWLGTGYGLFRFDGIKFERIPPPEGNRAKSEQINALLVARSGDLWVGYRSGGIAVYRGGKLRSVPSPQGDDTVNGIVQTPDGAIWISSYRDGLLLARFADGKWQSIGAGWGATDRVISSMVVDRAGTLWTAGWGGIYALPKGTRRFSTVVRDDVPDNRAMRIDDLGRVWMISEDGLSLIGEAGRPIAPRLATHGKDAFDTHLLPRLLIDDAGNAWASDQVHGLFYMTPGANGMPGARLADRRTFTTVDGLSSNAVTALFQGREGEVWVGTANGLDRFRKVSVLRDLSTIGRHIGSPFADRRGRIYVVDDGLRRLHPDPAVLTGPLKDVGAICDAPDESLWLVADSVTYHFSGGKLASFRRSDDANFPIYGCVVGPDAAVWVAAGSRGLLRVVGSVWTKTAVPGLQDQNARINAVRFDAQGRMLVVMRPGGIKRIDGGRATPISDGSGIGEVNAISHYGGSVVFGGPGGIGLFDGKDSHTLSATAFPWMANVKSIARSADDTWLLTSRGLIRIANKALLAALDRPGSDLPHSLFDLRDGLPALVIVGSNKDLAAADDGSVWVVTTDGLAMVDPRRIVRNEKPPPVVITALRANNATIPDPRQIDLAAGTSQIEIDFAALSLSMPERVQVRYRLEGVDNGWVDPGTRRQAFYTGLGPGKYRFRVIAANSDGVWNRDGAVADIDIPPTFTQSRWFVLLCVAAFGLVLWGLYTFRVRQLTARVHNRLEARQAERERIARDLHDTLLQGFQGLVLHIQAATERVPAELVARPMLDRALDQADLVLVEGRDRVCALRNDSMDGLEASLVRAAEQCAERGDASFRLTIEGSPRPLNPIVRDEAGLIGQEAIRNAYQHAAASRIDVLIVFQHRYFRLSVRDDGCGIADRTLADGKSGHFGLVGMRERAARIGGKLTVVGIASGGTEVALVVGRQNAYRPVDGKRRWWQRWRVFSEIEHGDRS